MSSIWIIHLFLVSTFSSLLVSCCCAACKEPDCSIDVVYQLGDSLADTGNFIRIVDPSSTFAVAARLPYGETIGKRTGRFSDGLLIIDYLTKFLGIPLLNPILRLNRSFMHGANFAVARSTVLDSSFYKARNVSVPDPNVPLRAQLQLLKYFLSSTCKSPSDCAERMNRSLVMVGAMGFNDFFYSFSQGKSIQEARTYVPFVVREMINVTRELLKLGFRKVIVSGDYPIGCSPYYPTNFMSNDSSAYDDQGCLISFNDLEKYRNSYIRAALEPLRREFPQTTILYGDFYGGYQYILRFDPSSVLKACCGTGGPYNFNISMFCGFPGVPVCLNPDRLISWDGIHLTQAAHHRIAEFIIKQIFRASWILLLVMLLKKNYFFLIKA